MRQKKPIDIRQEIKNRLVAYLSKSGVDGYGQIGVLSPHQVFNEITEEVIAYDNETNLLGIATYGGRFGAYKGFNVNYMKDEEIRQACYEARKQNPTYIHAMTSY
jgi:hypothetical protein